MDLIKDFLFNFPDKCIYGLINSQDKRIYLNYTTNLLYSLSRIIKENKYSNNLMNKDNNKLDLIIIEEINNSRALKLRLGYWINEYSNKGYEFYWLPKHITRYKCRIDLLEDFRASDRKRSLCYVKLVSKGYHAFTVGVFSETSDANDFKSKHYKEVNNIIYADNDLTREYLKLHE